MGCLPAMAFRGGIPAGGKIMRLCLPPSGVVACTRRSPPQWGAYAIPLPIGDPYLEPLVGMPEPVHQREHNGGDHKRGKGNSLAERDQP